jgi:hypothetical protein
MLRQHLVAIVAILVAGTAFGSARQPSLEVLLEQLKATPDASPGPVVVTAVGLAAEMKPVLRFRLTNISNTPYEADSRLVPWQPLGCISLVALVSPGRALALPLQDLCIPFLSGPPSPLIVAPGQTVSGDCDVSGFLESLGIPPGTDVAVVWTYRHHSGVAAVHTPKYEAARSNKRLERAGMDKVAFVWPCTAAAQPVR